jgi:hypothetical protein
MGVIGWSCRTHRSHHKCVQLWGEKSWRKKSCGKSRILRKECMMKWNDIIWPRIKTVTLVLLTWYRNFGFCKRRKISCLSEMWFGKVPACKFGPDTKSHEKFSPPPSLLSNEGIVLPVKPLPLPYIYYSLFTHGSALWGLSDVKRLKWTNRKHET